MNNVYCEGAKAAEILFSLTGGKEGRLMSYAPPVEIYSNVKYRFYKVRQLDFFMNPVKTYFDDIAVYEDEAINYLFDSRQIQTNNSNEPGWLHRVYKYRDGVNGGREILKVFYEEKLYNNQIVEQLSTPLKKGFVIVDTQGYLYAHSVPEGFTPTWQVNCIGCNPGECAGSDGKGGVVCMDCADMDRSIQAIKRSLSR